MTRKTWAAVLAIKYFGDRGGNLSREEDNPLSPHFVAPRKRTKNAAARWWALWPKKMGEMAHAEVSHEKALDTIQAK